VLSAAAIPDRLHTSYGLEGKMKVYTCSDNFNLIGHDIDIEAETANKARQIYSKANEIPYKNVMAHINKSAKLSGSNNA